MDRWFAVHGAEEEEGSCLQNKQTETSIKVAYFSAEGCLKPAVHRWADMYKKLLLAEESLVGTFNWLNFRESDLRATLTTFPRART